MGNRTILITGASAGLGAALARASAAPGRRLILTGRDAGRLAEVTGTCRDRGASVISGEVDVRDFKALSAFIHHAADDDRRIDVAICNAGIFSGRRKGDILQPFEQECTLVDINLKGLMATVQAVLPKLRRGGGPRLALVSSLAAYHPVADAPAYSAAKAGVAAYGEALRELLAPDIGVTIVLPGHIATAQTEVHEGALPMLIPADRAAQRILRGLARGQDEVVFPRRLHWLGLAGRILPNRLRWRFNAPLRFTVRPGDPL